ncbi:uncharacterized protein LOC117490630 [Trematomus bernacchii]|uniref:uncharacterized protein LOC117490630 n=1 Tax=Trematomus bernacchii TaxID=40690 RepID=UPI00146E59D7|nr:uncharacterized protein LOC117490630 [Trematomus bernacchii]
MESEKKRRKYSTSSNDSDTTDSQMTSWSRSSKNTVTSSTWVRLQHKKPSEVFRTDFITAMKVPDSAQLGPGDFYVLSDPWRQEWEKGVQVPASLEAIPEPVVRLLSIDSSDVFSDNMQEKGSITQPSPHPGLPPPSATAATTWTTWMSPGWSWSTTSSDRWHYQSWTELTMECVLVELERHLRGEDAAGHRGGGRPRHRVRRGRGV